VLGYAEDLQTLDPVVSTDQNANDLMYPLLYTPLVAYDSSFQVRPWLARSWELSDTAVVFELRDDVRWHDGRPVTAEDVKFTFDLARNPATASPLAAAYLTDVLSAEVLGPHRIRFLFSAPHADPLQDFVWPPVPKHLLEEVDPAHLADAPFGRRPVGSGPYRLVRWDAGQELLLQAVDSFPAALGGPPAIHRISYRILPEATTRLQELLRGDIQVDGPLEPQEAPRVEASDRAWLAAFPWRQFTYIGWNARDSLFADPAVRRALTMAIDRRALLQATLYGHGSPAVGPVPPWHPYAPRLTPLPYAPDSARAILARAGWRDTDGDGVLDREGRPFRFRLLASQANATFPDLVQMIQAQLGKVGIDVQPELLEWQTVLSRHRARDFQAVLTNWVLDNFKVDPRPLFSTRAARTKGSANRSSYSNPVADSLMEVGTRTTDPERARETWAAFEKVLQHDQPFTFLFWNDELAGVGRDLAGVHMDARGELYTLPSWRWAGGSQAGGSHAGESDAGGTGRGGGRP
jgi:peptide/nickel transport system substrate-binding protein